MRGTEDGIADDPFFKPPSPQSVSQSVSHYRTGSLRSDLDGRLHRTNVDASRLPSRRTIEMAMRRCSLYLPPGRAPRLTDHGTVRYSYTEKGAGPTAEPGPMRGIGRRSSKGPGIVDDGMVHAVVASRRRHGAVQRHLVRLATSWRGNGGYRRVHFDDRMISSPVALSVMWLVH